MDRSNAKQTLLLYSDVKNKNKKFRNQNKSLQGVIIYLKSKLNYNY